MNHENIVAMQEEAGRRPDAELIEVIISDALELTSFAGMNDFSQTLEKTQNFTLARLIVNREELHRRFGSTPLPFHDVFGQM